MRCLRRHCGIGYAGRLDTRLAPGDRVVLFKDDGSVCVHALKGREADQLHARPDVVVEETDDVILGGGCPASGETLTILAGCSARTPTHLFDLRRRRVALGAAGGA